MESSLGYSVGVHNSESLQLFMHLCEVLHCDLGVMSVSPLSIRAIRSSQLDVMLPCQAKKLEVINSGILECCLPIWVKNIAAGQACHLCKS
jgi:hypothetical protein